jgi:transcriptional regulator with XRE-family HTH domain
VNAETVRKRRKQLKWSLRRLALELGVTSSVAWRIENVGPTGDEVARVTRVLALNGDDVEKTEESGEYVNLEEWRGLRTGDACRILNREGNVQRAVFKFQRYRRTEFQECVDLTGSRGEARTVRPEAVRDARGRELPDP